MAFFIFEVRFNHILFRLLHTNKSKVKEKEWK